MTTINLILCAVFVFAVVYVVRKLVIMKKVVKIYGKVMILTLILLGMAATLVIMSFFVKNTLGDWLQMFCMCSAMVAFALLRDGIGETGIFYSGAVIPYDSVKNYDVQKVKKKTVVYFKHGEVDKKGNHSQYYGEVTFKDTQFDEVSTYLKGKIGKKYLRMPKNA